jgi:hypothetical protein
MAAFWLWATMALMPPEPANPALSGFRSMAIDGGATCPTAVEVALRFFALMAPTSATAVGRSQAAAEGGDRARIDTVDDAVEIVLRRADGTLIGRRRLQAQGPCDERARIAAIVLATWESDVHPVLEREVAPPPEPSAPSEAAARDVVKPMPPVSGPRGQAKWDLGVGASTSVAGGAFVVGARAAGALLRASGIGAQRVRAGEGERSTTAGSGQAVWSRITAGAGPVYRRHLAAWATEANLTLVAALFRVRGEQYPVRYRSSGWDGGVVAGVRLIGPGEAWRPWLAIDVTRWLDRRDVREAVSGQAQEIPAWAASTSLGVSFFGR